MLNRIELCRSYNEFYNTSDMCMCIYVYWVSINVALIYFMLNDPVQDMVLMRALRDMNLPKFVFEDVPLFLGLVSDLFPGLHCPRVRYADFNGAVENSLEENRFSILPDQVSHRPSLPHRSLRRSFPLLPFQTAFL